MNKGDRMHTQVEPKKCQGVLEIDTLEQFFANQSFYTQKAQQGFAIVLKNRIDKQTIEKIKRYLFNVGAYSLPAYHPLTSRIPDHHLILNHHPDSTITSKVHKFYFYPWNQNMFDFFRLFENIFKVKNILSDLPEDAYYNATAERDDFVLRCVFHHYPPGGGFIARHSDTVGIHQKVTAILTLSSKGEEFHSGGLYVIGSDERKIYVDDMLPAGSVLFFNPEIIHGVDPIDEDRTGDFMNIQGRWIMIAATIKTARNTEAATAKELEKNQNE